MAGTLCPFSIEQDYARYTQRDHQTWSHLYSRMGPQWRRFANPLFLEGIEALRLDPNRVPRLADVNRFLAARTGFRTVPVSGYVPAYQFFDCLRRREFPTTITLRDPDQLDYLPEPDIFHDVCGHVPMHANVAFAEALVRFGDCARAAGATSSQEKLENRIRALARFFWFTVEFGLMRCSGELRAYGSGLLSSFGELQHSLTAAEVHRQPISLDWVIHQSFEIHHYQPLLFVVESFEHLFELAGELEGWMRAGRLDLVAPGEPHIHAEDIEGFRSAR